MKTLVSAFLLFGISAFTLAQSPPSLVNGNGAGISNPAFRNAVLPSQTSQAGKYLKTDGTSATWEDVTGATVPDEEPIYGTYYGVIAGDSADATAEANAVALTTAAAASSTLKKPLILTGDIYIKGEWLLSGNDITIIGHGATVIQKDLTKPGMTFDTQNVVFGLRVIGLRIHGQGPATHNSAGVFGKNDWKVTFSGIPLAGETITVNGAVYTFVAGAPGANQIQIGSSAADQATKLVTALTGNADCAPTTSGQASGVVRLARTNFSTWTVTEAATNTSVTVPYLTSDITFRDCWIYNFRTGMEMANIAKFESQNLTVNTVRVGHHWIDMQTALLLASRITTGDGDASAVCFNLSGTGFFANKVIGGEFGGTGFQKFLYMPGGQLNIEGCNLENFSSTVPTFDLPAGTGKTLSVVNSRMATTYDTTCGIISAECSTTSVPTIQVNNIYGWGGSPRVIEVWGSSIGRFPYYFGDQQQAVTSLTQGGTAISSRMIGNIRSTFGTSYLPTTGTTQAGELYILRSESSQSNDQYCDNLLFRVQNNRTGTKQWTSLNNDVLYKVFASAYQVANSTTAETDLIKATLPALTMAEPGESFHLEAHGITAADGTDKQLRVYFSSYATLETNLTNAINNDLTFTSRLPGPSGGSTTISYVISGTGSSVISVSVVGNAVTVTAGSATTAATVATAIAAEPAAASLVTVANKSGNNGSGVIATLAATALAGGIGAPLDFGAVAANNEAWHLKINVQRGFGGTGQQKMIGVLTLESSGTIVRRGQVTPTATNPITCLLTGQGAASNAITMDAGKMWWVRTASGL